MKAKASTKSVKQQPLAGFNSSAVYGGFDDHTASAKRNNAAIALALEKGGDDQENCGTPYRSLNRVNRLLNNTPFKTEMGSSRIIDTTPSSASKQFYSKPSSVTTACTYAPNEMSATKSVCSTKYGSSAKRSSRKSDVSPSVSQKSTTKKESKKS